MKSHVLAALSTAAQSLFVVIVVATLACVTPLPPSPGPSPVPTPDASVTMFDDATIDCAIIAENPPVDRVRTCLDVTNTDTCMEDLVAGTITKDVVGCTARGLSMLLHVAIAKDVATAQMSVEAAAADSWFRRHRISVRR
jgi:hypothetical protein